MTNCVACGTVCVRVNAALRVPDCIKFIDTNYRYVAESAPLCVVCANILESLGYTPVSYPYTCNAQQVHYPQHTGTHNGHNYTLSMQNVTPWSSGYGSGVMAQLTLTVTPIPAPVKTRTRTAKKCGMCADGH
ncbi:hypothetical protein F-M6_0080 [Faustovirus]|nr:hypothetical protein F-M6_0080 [Faustovirus]QJX73854.1 hypothetical protein F-E9_81 [Faustovirus]